MALKILNHLARVGDVTLHAHVKIFSPCSSKKALKRLWQEP